MMSRSLRLLVRVAALALFVPLLVAVAPLGPARAASYGRVTVPDGVLWPSCLPRMVVAHYRFNPPTTSWAAEFTVIDPRGHAVAGNMADSDADPVEGDMPFGFCKTNAAYGWYRLTTRFTSYDAAHPQGTDSWLPVARFHLGKPHTRTRLLTPRLARSLRQTKQGYVANGYQWVAVQVRRDGSWRTVQRLATGPRGYVTFRVPSGSCVRVRTLPRKLYRASVSRSLVA